jgi:hypothetical protein
MAFPNPQRKKGGDGFAVVEGRNRTLTMFHIRRPTFGEA